jgi:hypothetical protein
MRTGTSVADPDPRSGTFLTPGSGMGKISGSLIRDKHPRSFSGSLETVCVKNIYIFDADPDPGCAMEKFGSGIRYKYPGSTTLTGFRDKVVLSVIC